MNIENIRLTTIQAAYIGAIIDTDGYIDHPHGTQRSKRVSVTNQNLEILSVLLRTVGGSVGLQRIGVKAPIWQWWLSASKTDAFARAIAPYSTKAQQYLNNLTNA